jgi:hypothetical protein
MQRTDNDLPDNAQQQLRTLPATAESFKVTLDRPQADRTSNQVDRLLNDLTNY